MKKILITGGTGFIGATLVPLLVEQGYHVRLLMRKKSLPLAFKNLNIEVSQGSLEDIDSLKTAVRDVDFIIHLAGIVATSKSENFYKINSDGTRHLAEAVYQENKNLKNFICVSSLAAGGPMKEQKERTEEMLDEPVSHYGKSKRQGEMELQKFKGKFPFVILRPSIVFGPEDKGVFIIIKSAISKLTPMLKPHSKVSEKAYSMIYVKDLCQVLLIFLKQPQYINGEIFYISDGLIYKFSDILNSVTKVTQKKGFRISLPFFLIRGAATLCEWITQTTGKPLPLNKDKLNELKSDFWICSNFRISGLGFQPQYSLDDAMKETIDWYKSNGWL